MLTLLHKCTKFGKDISLFAVLVPFQESATGRFLQSKFASS